jgi:hypothetical protein
MRDADELFKAKRSIELRYYNRSDETAVHDATTEDNYYKQKTIKYSASSWKHKGMRLLRLWRT